jgi:hypothetical protein
VALIYPLQITTFYPKCDFCTLYVRFLNRTDCQTWHMLPYARFRDIIRESQRIPTVTKDDGLLYKSNQVGISNNTKESHLCIAILILLHSVV